jgi:hypothetical protein
MQSQLVRKKKKIYEMRKRWNRQPETWQTYEEILDTIRDSLRNVASSDDRRNGVDEADDEEDIVLGTLQKKD